MYPATVKTVADQLEAERLSWKGYMEDMGDDPVRDGATTCAHPAIGTPDRTQQASAVDQYATRHNPFVYFHSVIDRSACAARDVALARLAPDLASAATTPNLSFITPDLCHDGHDATCADGGPGGLPAADAFLRTWVPAHHRLARVPARRRCSSSPSMKRARTRTACCDEQPGPNTPAPGGQSAGPGGGRTGAVLLSPLITARDDHQRPYNHYSLLRSIEDAFGLAHLGYAAAPGLRSFGTDVFTAR